MGVEQGVDDMGLLVEAAANRGGNFFTRFAAQAGLFGQLDGQAAYGAHAADAGDDAQLDAELVVHEFAHVLQLLVAVDPVDPFEQFLFLFAREHQHAVVGVRIAEQLLAIAHAQAWRALDADRKWERLEHDSLKVVLPDGVSG